MRRDGNTLVVVVLERPSIESFEITGNKDIKTEDLQKSLRNVGLATGKTFDRSVLEDVTQYLTDQYFSRGKYGVRIDTQGRGGVRQPREDQDRHQGRQARQDPRDQHRRQHQVQAEGDPRHPRAEDARTGCPGTSRTTATRASRCRATWRRSATTTWTAATRTSRSTPRRWRSLPRRRTSSSPSTSTEGEVFKVSRGQAGRHVRGAARRSWSSCCWSQPGQTFNRKLITTTQELIQNRLGRDGYAFAKVEPVPTAGQRQRTPCR